MKEVLKEKFMKAKLQKIEERLTEILACEDKVVEELSVHTMKAGGKRLRPGLLLLVAEYYGCHSKDVRTMGAIVELIHLASLIHDDINDEANIRRGVPTVNAIHGDDTAVHLGDFLVTKALLEVFNTERYQDLLPILRTLAVEMSSGEFAQINDLYDVEQTLEDYYYRIARKTAILIAYSCKIGAMLAGASEKDIQAFYDFGYHIGIAFQIKDDLLDIAPESSLQSIGKPVGNDLLQGHLTLPTLLVLAKETPEAKELKALIAGEFKQDEEAYQRAVAIIAASDAAEKSYEILEKHIALAKSAIAHLPNNKIKPLFDKGAEYIYQRKY